MHLSRVVPVYGAAFVQGLAVVAFPASGTVLRSVYGLSEEAYGSLFLPQTALTIVGSLVGGALARRVGLRVLLVASSVAAALSQGALLGVTMVGPGSVLPLLLAGTGLMGLGFGLAAAPLNTYPGQLFPERRDPALLALHTVLGAGFTFGPVAAGLLVGNGAWHLFPGLIGAIALVVAAAGVGGALPAGDGAGSQQASAPLNWPVTAAFALVAVLYAFAEGTFSNWAAIYLHEARGVAESSATLAISGFWAGLTAGRLLGAGLVARVAPEKLWLALPIAMAATFWLLPLADGAASGIALFVLAGLSASAFFPLTVAIASKRFPGREALVSSLLIAALMVGVGAGSYLLGALRREASFDALYRLSMLYPLAALALGAVLVAAGRRARR